MATIDLNEIRDSMKGVILPSRRKLRREKPWDDEQIAIFIKRQRSAEKILAESGIKFTGRYYLWPDGEYRREKP